MAAMCVAAPLALTTARPLKAQVRTRSVARRGASPVNAVASSTGSHVPASLGVCAARAGRGSLAAGNHAIAMDMPGQLMQYNETGKWRENFDLKGWAAEVRAVEKELKAEVGEADVAHLAGGLL